MNTPAHVIINLYVLKGEEKKSHQSAVTLGALLPDMPMFGFYFYEKVIQKVPEMVIWREHYHLSGWQNFFDLFNSIPIAAAGLVLSLRKKCKAWSLLFASVLLHIAGDIFLHNKDAHGHFFPLSDWRFHSPVSYWDPQRYGLIVSWVEIGVTLCLGFLLMRHFRLVMNRLLTGAWLLVYVAYGAYVYFVWLLPHA